MNSNMAAWLISLLFVFAGSHAAQWTSSSPSDGFELFGCVGDTITFRWEYILASGQTIGEITWLYGGHSQEVVAIFTHGIFVPTPPFSHRVQQVGNAGISLTNVLVGDSGNYSVEVQVFQDSNSHVIMRRAVFVRIHDTLMTTGGVLHASQSPEAVLDPNTGRFALPLTCGEFTFNHDPPFQVEWLTPSGQVVSSTDFQDHHFRLLLHSPVQGGNFTCRIPPHSAGEACLHGNAGHQGEATVYVDKVESRLSILEKENEVLKAQLQQSNGQLNQVNSTLLNHVESALNQVSSNLNQVSSNLNQVSSNLNHVNSSLSGRLQKLEEAAGQQVAFHATAGSGYYPHPPADTPIIFPTVHYNQGNGYSSSTGYFTAPYNATYYFIATTGGDDNNQYAIHYLMVDSTQMGRAYTYNSGGNQDSVPVHAVVHLQPGQRVWIKGDGSTYACCDYSMFSGFLLAHDP